MQRHYNPKSTNQSQNNPKTPGWRMSKKTCFEEGIWDPTSIIEALWWRTKLESPPGLLISASPWSSSTLHLFSFSFFLSLRASSRCLSSSSFISVLKEGLISKSLVLNTIPSPNLLTALYSLVSQLFSTWILIICSLNP